MVLRGHVDSLGGHIAPDIHGFLAGEAGDTIQHLDGAIGIQHSAGTEAELVPGDGHIAIHEQVSQGGISIHHAVGGRNVGLHGHVTLGHQAHAALVRRQGTGGLHGEVLAGGQFHGPILGLHLALGQEIPARFGLEAGGGSHISRQSHILTGVKGHLPLSGDDALLGRQVSLLRLDFHLLGLHIPADFHGIDRREGCLACLGLEGIGDEGISCRKGGIPIRGGHLPQGGKVFSRLEDHIQSRDIPREDRLLSALGVHPSVSGNQFVVHQHVAIRGHQIHVLGFHFLEQSGGVAGIDNHRTILGGELHGRHVMVGQKTEIAAHGGHGILRLDVLPCLQLHHAVGGGDGAVGDHRLFLGGQFHETAFQRSLGGHVPQIGLQGQDATLDGDRIFGHQVGLGGQGRLGIGLHLPRHGKEIAGIGRHPPLIGRHGRQGGVPAGMDLDFPVGGRQLAQGGHIPLGPQGDALGGSHRLPEGDVMSGGDGHGFRGGLHGPLHLEGSLRGAQLHVGASDIAVNHKVLLAGYIHISLGGNALQGHVLLGGDVHAALVGDHLACHDALAGLQVNVLLHIHGGAQGIQVALPGLHEEHLGINFASQGHVVQGRDIDGPLLGSQVFQVGIFPGHHLDVPLLGNHGAHGVHGAKGQHVQGILGGDGVVDPDVPLRQEVHIPRGGGDGGFHHQVPGTGLHDDFPGRDVLIQGHGLGGHNTQSTIVSQHAPQDGVGPGVHDHISLVRLQGRQVGLLPRGDGHIPVGGGHAQLSRHIAQGGIQGHRGTTHVSLQDDIALLGFRLDISIGIHHPLNLQEVSRRQGHILQGEDIVLNRQILSGGHGHILAAQGRHVGILPRLDGQVSHQGGGGFLQGDIPSRLDGHIRFGAHTSGQGHILACLRQDALVVCSGGSAHGEISFLGLQGDGVTLHVSGHRQVFPGLDFQGAVDLRGLQGHIVPGLEGEISAAEGSGKHVLARLEGGILGDLEAGQAGVQGSLLGGHIKLFSVHRAVQGHVVLGVHHDLPGSGDIAQVGVPSRRNIHRQVGGGDGSHGIHVLSRREIHLSASGGQVSLQLQVVSGHQLQIAVRGGGVSAHQDVALGGGGQEALGLHGALELDARLRQDDGVPLGGREPAHGGLFPGFQGHRPVRGLQGGHFHIALGLHGGVIGHGGRAQDPGVPCGGDVERARRDTLEGDIVLRGQGHGAGGREGALGHNVVMGGHGKIGGRGHIALEGGQLARLQGHVPCGGGEGARGGHLQILGGVNGDGVAGHHSLHCRIGGGGKGHILLGRHIPHGHAHARHGHFFGGLQSHIGDIHAGIQRGDFNGIGLHVAFHVDWSLLAVDDGLPCHLQVAVHPEAVSGQQASLAVRGLHVTKDHQVGGGIEIHLGAGHIVQHLDSSEDAADGDLIPGLQLSVRHRLAHGVHVDSFLGFDIFMEEEFVACPHIHAPPRGGDFLLRVHVPCVGLQFHIGASDFLIDLEGSFLGHQNHVIQADDAPRGQIVLGLQVHRIGSFHRRQLGIPPRSGRQVSHGDELGGGQILGGGQGHVRVAGQEAIRRHIPHLGGNLNLVGGEILVQGHVSFPGEEVQQGDGIGFQRRGLEIHVSPCLDLQASPIHGGGHDGDAPQGLQGAGVREGDAAPRHQGEVSGILELSGSQEVEKAFGVQGEVVGASHGDGVVQGDVPLPGRALVVVQGHGVVHQGIGEIVVVVVGQDARAIVVADVFDAHAVVVGFCRVGEGPAVALAVIEGDIGGGALAVGAAAAKGVHGGRQGAGGHGGVGARVFSGALGGGVSDDQAGHGIDEDGVGSEVAQIVEGGVFAGELGEGGDHGAFLGLDQATAGIGGEDDLPPGGLDGAVIDHGGIGGIGHQPGEIQGELAAVAEVVQGHGTGGAHQGGLVGLDGAVVLHIPGDEGGGGGVDDRVVHHAGGGIPLEAQVAPPEVLVLDVIGGGDELVHIDDRPGTEEDAIGVHQIESAGGPEGAVDFGGGAAHHPGQHGRILGNLADVHSVSGAHVKGIPVDDGLGGGLVNGHGLPIDGNGDLSLDHIGTGGQAARQHRRHRPEEHDGGQEGGKGFQGDGEPMGLEMRRGCISHGGFPQSAMVSKVSSPSPPREGGRGSRGGRASGPPLPGCLAARTGVGEKGGSAPCPEYPRRRA